MKRSLLILVCLAGLVLATTACTPRARSVDAIRRNFPSAEQSKAERVAQCESSMNPEAVSPGGGNWGLFQINTVHKPLVQRMGYSWSQITDPYVNSKVARVIYNEADRYGWGWSPWGCRNA